MDPRARLTPAGESAVDRIEDGIFAGVALALITFVARRQRGFLTGAWTDLVRAVPGIARVAIALGLGYLAADRMLAFGGVRATMPAALITVAFLAVLFPAEDDRLRPAKVRRVRVSQ